MVKGTGWGRGLEVTAGGRGLVPLAGFVVWMDRLQIPPEELALEATFGDEYRRYARHVPRWLGRATGR